MTDNSFDKKNALAFIVAFGIVSLFADMAYEGMRGIAGPYLALLGASGTAVGIIAGTGELAGYLLRLASGRLVQRTQAYWAITLAGYALQMLAVPLMALAGQWWIAAGFIIAERTGKALRNPAANTMLSRAGEKIGQGWAFGLHEALDQTGALAGPLITALVLARHGQYTTAFLWLGVPALITLAIVVGVSLAYPWAGRATPPAAKDDGGTALPRAFWLYAATSALVAFGFADWPLIAYHFAQAKVVSPTLVPVLYAGAMGAAGAAALIFGRLFDRIGFVIIVPAILIAAVSAPLAFLGNETLAIVGAICWGAALGVETSALNAGVAKFVPDRARANAFGIFSAVFGIAWFAGSAAMGALYDVSATALVAVSIAAETVALVPLVLLIRERA
ncbi:MAG: MFS transporter [Alphaproteobacteria bacterium]|nr:MFS transporter [Alphaproteobacteria bacterium]